MWVIPRQFDIDASPVKKGHCDKRFGGGIAVSAGVQESQMPTCRLKDTVGNPGLEEGHDPVEVLAESPGKPDERFLRYIHKKYGIENLISFTGKEPAHDLAKKLGMNVKIYEWSTRRLPDRKELEEVLNFIDKNNNILIHCAGGSDRTGYTVAFYRMWRKNWSAEKAVKEMEKYWHNPEKKKALHEEIRELIKIKNES